MTQTTPLAHNTPRMSAFSSRAFRDALGRFATGVTVVTTRDPDGRPVGLTVNSFASVSLEPPLVSFCLDREAFSYPAFAESRSFAVNVLSAGQVDLSRTFAQASLADKFAAIATAEGATGCPLLPGALAQIECEIEMRHAAGDHVILIGRVVALEVAEDGLPLLYYRGRYADLLPPS